MGNLYNTEEEKRNLEYVIILFGLGLLVCKALEFSVWLFFRLLPLFIVALALYGVWRYTC